MDWNNKNIFLININLVFLIWVICLFFLIVFRKNEEKAISRNRKYPGINIKEF